MKIFLLCTLIILTTINLFGQIDWNNYAGNPVIDSTMDPNTYNAYGPNVLFDGTTYHMWYTRKTGNKEKIGYLTSPNGIAWTLIDSLALEPSTDLTRFDCKKLGQGSVLKRMIRLKCGIGAQDPMVTLSGMPCR